ncbi:MAG: alpha/beta hydrolase [Clostridia bacterium]|nr:alpha/beta hydrolase [Clostridia bacterium]
MILEKIAMQGAGDVSLTAYILEPSKEMPNMTHRPSVLVIPGGAYRFCSDREAEPIAMAFLTQGYSAFVLRYSVQDAGMWPNPLRDAENAMRLIRSRADEWDLDPQRIAAIGFSAGGHLTAALGTIGAERPNALILGYPCILDEMECIEAFRAPTLDGYVTAETPPTFIFAASDDGCVPIRHSLRFAEALDAAGVPFQLHIFDRGGHGFSLATHVVAPDPAQRALYREDSRWVPMCTDWLNRIFGVA